MLRACASHTTRLDLAAVRRVLAEELDILVIDVVHVLLAELAILATRLTLKILSHV